MPQNRKFKKATFNCMASVISDKGNQSQKRTVLCYDENVYIKSRFENSDEKY